MIDEIHKIYYESTADRHYWECQTCSASGSGPTLSLRRYDPEEHAERVHNQVGITRLVSTNRRYEDL